MAKESAVLDKPDKADAPHVNNGVAAKPRPEDDPRVQELARIIDEHNKKGKVTDDKRAEDAENSRQRVRDRSGRFQKKDDEAVEESENVEQQTEAKADAAETAKPPEFSDEEYQTAVRAMVRDGWDQDQIEALAEKDIAKFIAKGKKRAKAQADGDDFTKKHRTLQQELNALKKGVQTGPKDKANAGDAADKPDDSKSVTTRPVAPASTDEQPTDVRSLSDYLENLAGEKGAEEPVQKAFGALDKRAADRIARVEQAIAQRDNQFVNVVDGLNSLLNDAMLRLAVKELEVEFPDLKKPEFRAAVLKESAELGFSDSRPDHESLLRYAVMVVDAPKRWKQVESHRERVQEARRNGTPTPPRSAQDSPTRKMSQDKLRTEMLLAKMRRDESKYSELKAEWDQRFPRA